MSFELSRNESVLPPGYKLQVIKNAEGFLETVPLGTNALLPYGAGMNYRNRIAEELRKLFCQEYGFTPWSNKEVMTICADIDGNECVWCKARIHPKIQPDRMLKTSKPQAALPVGNSDVIDI
jgi:hypothetical protein